MGKSHSRHLPCERLGKGFVRVELHLPGLLRRIDLLDTTLSILREARAVAAVVPVLGMLAGVSRGGDENSDVLLRGSVAVAVI